MKQKAPEYFNEGSLLKAMENPQNHIDLNDKSMQNTQTFGDWNCSN